MFRVIRPDITMGIPNPDQTPSFLGRTSPCDTSSQGSGTFTFRFDIHRELLNNREFNNRFTALVMQLAKLLNGDSKNQPPNAYPPGWKDPKPSDEVMVQSGSPVCLPISNKISGTPVVKPGSWEVGSFEDRLNPAQQVIRNYQIELGVFELFNSDAVFFRPNWMISGHNAGVKLSINHADSRLASIIKGLCDNLFRLGGDGPTPRSIAYFDAEVDKVPFPPCHLTSSEYLGFFSLKKAIMPERFMLALVKCFQNDTMPIYDRYAALLSLKYLEKILCDQPNYAVREDFSPKWWAEVMRCGILMMFGDAQYDPNLLLNPTPIELKVRYIRGNQFDKSSQDLADPDFTCDDDGKAPIQSITLPTLSLREARQLFWRFMAESRLCEKMSIKVLELNIGRDEAKIYAEAHQKTRGEVTQALMDLGFFDLVQKAVKDELSDTFKFVKEAVDPESVKTPLELSGFYKHVFHFIENVMIKQNNVKVQQFDECLQEMINWITPSKRVNPLFCALGMQSFGGMERLFNCDPLKMNHIVTALKSKQGAAKKNPAVNVENKEWYEAFPILWAYCKGRIEETPDLVITIKKNLCLAIANDKPSFNSLMKAITSSNDSSLMKPISVLKKFVEHVERENQKMINQLPAFFASPLYKLNQFDNPRVVVKCSFFVSFVSRLINFYRCCMGEDKCLNKLIQGGFNLNFSSCLSESQALYVKMRDMQRNFRKSKVFISEEMVKKLLSCNALEDMPSFGPSDTQVVRAEDLKLEMKREMIAFEVLLRNPKVTPELVQQAILHRGLIVPGDGFLERCLGCRGINLKEIFDDVKKHKGSNINIAAIRAVEKMIKTNFYDAKSIKTG